MTCVMTHVVTLSFWAGGQCHDICHDTVLVPAFRQQDARVMTCVMTGVMTHVMTLSFVAEGQCHDICHDTVIVPTFRQPGGLCHDMCHDTCHDTCHG
eukprot:536922-Karenia_brevis.AAC.1